MKATRRTLLKVLGIGLAYPFSAIAADPDYVTVDTSKVKNLSDLVDAIKQAAGERLPPRVELREMYRAFAVTFIDYAQDAISQGKKIPNILAKRLPFKRKVFVPIMVVIALWGINFLVPLSIFFDIMLASLVIMWFFITAELKSHKKNSQRAAANGETLRSA